VALKIPPAVFAHDPERMARFEREAKVLEDRPAAGEERHSPTLSLAATRAGVMLGTAAYMSPEQIKGRPADRRAGIWAFGMVLFELLTGRQVLFRREHC